MLYIYFSPNLFSPIFSVYPCIAESKTVEPKSQKDQFCYIHSVTVLSRIVKTKPKHCPVLHPASPSSFLAEVGRYCLSYKAKDMRKRWDCAKLRLLATAMEN